MLTSTEMDLRWIAARLEEITDKLTAIVSKLYESLNKEEMKNNEQRNQIR